KKSFSSLLNSSFGWLVLIALLVLVNITATFFKFRIDLTEEKRFSLSTPTKKLLKHIDSTITVDVLLEGELPADFRKLQVSTKDLLNEMKEYAGKKLEYNFINSETIEKDSAYQLMLASFDLIPTARESQTKKGEEKVMLYPFAVVNRGDKKIGIDLLKGKIVYDVDPINGTRQINEAKSINAAESLLEFKIADAIDKIQQQNKPVIGYLMGNGEPPIGPPNGIETYDLVKTLEANYRLFTLDINTHPVIPLEFKALLIVRPTQKFEDSTKQKIDQYIMQGGKVLWSLDNLDANKDSLARLANTVAFDMGINLDDQLFKYGVRINRDLVQDMQCDMVPIVIGQTGGQAQIQPIPFNYYPLLTPSNNNAITRNMEPVLGQYVNSIDTVKAEGIKKTVLLSSSENSKFVSTPAIISLNELKTIEEPKLYNKKFLPVAYLLEGKFNSTFAHRTSQETINQFEQWYKTPFKTQCDEPTKMIVISDGDIFLNKYSQSQQQEPPPMGLSNTQQQLYANRTFLLNALEYLVNPSGIIETRNKDITLRLLNKTKVEEEKTKWQIINIAVPVLLVIAAGFIFQQIRKKKYS
ncbi:MAG: gliding motility-associated ABC transporter substrate-binding protein GldG, partial [Sphingobacteriales bacterium]|nr:gliding motility-associated ABC transporter substrate-binding protein GldG [Sphingobacteriales bacterium]